MGDSTSQYTEEEIDEGRKQYNNTGWKIDKLTKENDAIEAEIDRLINAKDSVSESRDYYKTLSADSKKAIEAVKNWKGETYNSASFVLDTLQSEDKQAVRDFETYIKTIDSDIWRLRKKFFENGGILTNLWKAYNSLKERFGF